MRPRNGLFITFEGIEGCGKSTAAKSAARLFAALGRQVVFTREPGGTKFGESIREIILYPGDSQSLSPVEELFLFSASRARLTREVILPALTSGRDVISDRYMDSTFVYQGVGGTVSDEELRAVNKIATGGLLPDLTILLDLPADEGLARRRLAGSQNWIDRREIEYHIRVRERFLALARANPDRVKIVDSSGEKEATFALVQALLIGLLKAGSPV